MQKRIISRAPAMMIGVFAAAFALDGGALFAASDCLEQPNRAAAQGHWYYHVDRTNGRKCWYLSGSEVAAKPPQAEAPPQPSPDVASQPPLSSFFSSLTSGFTTASVNPSPPDAAGRDPRGTPNVQAAAPKNDDAVSSKRRQHADTKQAPVAKPDRQASSRSDKEPPAQSRPASLDQAERDALFREFLRWRDRQ
jgi:hypothetical protein